MGYNIPRYILVVFILLIITIYACSVESPHTPNSEYSELKIDSVSIYVVRGLHPDTGNPAGLFVWNFSYRLLGNTGAIYRVELFTSPPGDHVFGIQYNSYIKNDPFPENTPLEHQDDIWCECDYSDYDSISVHFSVEAIFWRQIDFQMHGNTIRIPRGEDCWNTRMMVDVRDE